MRTRLGANSPLGSLISSARMTEFRWVRLLLSPWLLRAQVSISLDRSSVAVGEVVMDAAVAWARERGCFGIDSVALPGNRETKNFFERFGLTARAIVVHRVL